nr:hypothetical protein CFP56_56945 [Quercus suber]
MRLRFIARGAGNGELARVYVYVYVSVYSMDEWRSSCVTGVVSSMEIGPKRTMVSWSKTLGHVSRREDFYFHLPFMGHGIGAAEFYCERGMQI